MANLYKKSDFDLIFADLGTRNKIRFKISRQLILLFNKLYNAMDLLFFRLFNWYNFNKHCLWCHKYWPVSLKYLHLIYRFYTLSNIYSYFIEIGFQITHAYFYLLLINEENNISSGCLEPNTLVLLKIKPSSLVALVTIDVICVENVNLLSSQTPKSFISNDRSRFVLFTV